MNDEALHKSRKNQREIGNKQNNRCNHIYNLLLKMNEKNYLNDE